MGFTKHTTVRCVTPILQSTKIGKRDKGFNGKKKKKKMVSQPSVQNIGSGAHGIDRFFCNHGYGADHVQFTYLVYYCTQFTLHCLAIHDAAGNNNNRIIEEMGVHRSR
jgi:hypothetical protein